MNVNDSGAINIVSEIKALTVVSDSPTEAKKISNRYFYSKNIDLTEVPAASIETAKSDAELEV